MLQKWGLLDGKLREVERFQKLEQYCSWISQHSHNESSVIDDGETFLTEGTQLVCKLTKETTVPAMTQMLTGGTNENLMLLFINTLDSVLACLPPL